jgi:hypothetical protein
MSEEEIRNFILRNLTVECDWQGSDVYVQLCYDGDKFSEVRLPIPKPESE